MFIMYVSWRIRCRRFACIAAAWSGALASLSGSEGGAALASRNLAAPGTPLLRREDVHRHNDGDSSLPDPSDEIVRIHDRYTAIRKALNISRSTTVPAAAVSNKSAAPESLATETLNASGSSGSNASTADSTNASTSANDSPADNATVCMYTITLERKYGCNIKLPVAGAPRDSFRVDGCSKKGCDVNGYCGADCIKHGFGRGIQIIRNQNGKEVGYGSCCSDPNTVIGIDANCTTKSPAALAAEQERNEVNAIKVCFKDSCKGKENNVIPEGEVWNKVGTGPKACCARGDEACDLCSKWPAGPNTKITQYAALYIERPLAAEQGNSVFDLTNVTLQTCKLYCDMYPNCRSLTYGINGGKKECHLKDKVVHASDPKIKSPYYLTYFQQETRQPDKKKPEPCDPPAAIVHVTNSSAAPNASNSSAAPEKGKESAKNTTKEPAKNTMPATSAGAIWSIGKSGCGKSC